MGIKSNMYSGVKTYNPIDGECPHRCTYCAVHKLFNRKLPAAISKYSGELRLNERELKRSLGKNNTWFLCGVGNDLFADGVKIGWIDRIIEHCFHYPDNTYMLQTKDSRNMYLYLKDRVLPDNFMLGITLETDIDAMMKYSGETDYFYDRAEWLRIINHKRKYITIEPIMSFSNEFINIIKAVEPELIYIGADSGKNNLPEPTKEEVTELICELMKFTNIDRKSNLTRLMK